MAQGRFTVSSAPARRANRQLAQVNARNAAIRRQERLRREQERNQRIMTMATIAGAATGGLAAAPAGASFSTGGAMFGASAGQLAGNVVTGQRTDPMALASLAAQGDQLMEQRATREATGDLNEALVQRAISQNQQTRAGAGVTPRQQPGAAAGEAGAMQSRPRSQAATRNIEGLRGLSEADLSRFDPGTVATLAQQMEPTPFTETVQRRLPGGRLEQTTTVDGQRTERQVSVRDQDGEITGAERINQRTNQELINASQRMVLNDSDLSAGDRTAQLRRLQALRTGGNLRADTEALTGIMRAEGLPVPSDGVGRGEITGTERINRATNLNTLQTVRAMARQQDMPAQQRQRVLNEVEQLRTSDTLIGEPDRFLETLRARDLPVPQRTESDFTERRSRATTAAEFALQDNLMASPEEIRRTVQDNFNVDPLDVNPQFFEKLPERRRRVATRSFQSIAAQRPKAPMSEVMSEFEQQTGTTAARTFIEPDALRDVAERTANQSQRDFMARVTRQARNAENAPKKRISGVLETLRSERDNLGPDQIEYTNKLLADLDDQLAAERDAGRLDASTKVAREHSLRREYRAESRDYSRVATAWTGIETGAAEAQERSERGEGTAGADFQIVNNFIRMNDPGGRVGQREQESVNLGGDVADDVQRAVASFTQGDSLSNDMRERIVSTSRRLAIEQAKAHMVRRRNLMATAEDQNLNPDNVVYPVHQALPQGVGRDEFLEGFQRRLEQAPRGEREDLRQIIEEELLLHGIDPLLLNRRRNG